MITTNGIELKQFAASESFSGRDGGFGIKIYAGSTVRELTNDDYRACKKHIEAIEKTIRDRIYLESPRATAAMEKEKRDLLSCFPQPIWVKEIPNEYWSNDVYGKTSPWFLVTTIRGVFKVGWRKRVIELDWSDTEIQHAADDLWPDKDNTKDGKSIHCWGYDVLKKRVDVLMNTIGPIDEKAKHFDPQ